MTQDRSYEDRAQSIRMIRDSVGAIVPAGAGLSRVRKLRFETPGFDLAVWREMGELGWIGLRLGEEHGGIGLGMVEACALAEELGRGLIPEPLIAGSLSAALLAASGDRDLLPAVLSGANFVATAWQEAPDSLSAPGSVDRDRLFIPMASGATAFLVPARRSDRLALYLLPVAEGTLTVLHTQDGGHFGSLRPDLSAGRRISDDVEETLARLLDEAALGTAAFLLGVMTEAFETTLAYLRTREQFGRKLGSFQALQHRAANLHIQLVLSRVSIETAAAELDAGAGAARRRSVVSRAKTRAAEASMLITREAVQLHGAIGYTDEYDIGLFLRKAMVIANQYGSPTFHRRRFVAEDREDDDSPR